MLALVAAAYVVPVPSAPPSQQHSQHQHISMSAVSTLRAPHQPVAAVQLVSVPAPPDPAEGAAQGASWVLPCTASHGTEPYTAAAARADANALPSQRKQPHSARRRRRKRQDSFPTGITPEHMLYWVSQADIAAQLRCTDGICPDESGPLACASATESSRQAQAFSPMPVLTPALDVDQLQQHNAASQTQALSPESTCTGVHSAGRPVSVQKPLKRRQC